MGQDCAGTWEDCGDDGKCCRTGHSQELDRSAYAAGSCGERTVKAFCWEVTLSLLHCSFHSSWSLSDTVPSTEVARVAEDLKESLVHPMAMLHCPRDCVRLTAGKRWHTWSKFSVATLGQYIRRKCGSYYRQT